MPPAPDLIETFPRAWLGILGQWQPDGGQATFTGADAAWQSAGRPVRIGIAVSDIEHFTNGEIEAKVRFEAPVETGYSAGIILGFRSLNDKFYYAEFSDVNGFSLAEFEPGYGFMALARTTVATPIQQDHQYSIKATLLGQRAELRVEGVKVLEVNLPRQSTGHQVAVIASGQCTVRFEHVAVRSARPKAFVATQFDDRFDRIWDQVIRRAAEEEGFHPIRIDEVTGANPILEDIQRHVAEAAVVIAEITPVNANVFYEVGYADALNKPLVLLAQRGTKLPFDIQGYRTVFYEDVIGGEARLLKELRGQLRAML